MPRYSKSRLDSLLCTRGLVASRSQAADLIRRGLVSVGGAKRLKPGTIVAADSALEVSDDRGAFLVFRNAGSDSINVLFRRPDGHLGLIEPDAD